ncbi:sensor histidine kinase [Falsiroseomonas oryzae]|uniref:sensor histidine kinase n=1 Tax=Falsiroseomonas oryzae TaxID=2766473 RepID=UPI0022EAC1FF|nr:HAMP domain-containing sensor histidine kinase [Roseomonas sp. MO-31]
MTRQPGEGAEDEAGERPMAGGEQLEAAAALSAAVAHDLGNMLTVLIGNAEFLMEGLAGQPDLAEMAKLIFGAAQRGSELTARLDQFGRRVQPAATPTDTAEALARFARRLEPGLPPGIRLEMLAEPDLGRVLVTPTALGLVLDELAANAVAAMGAQGRLRVIAGTEPAPAGGRRVILVVEDTGRGMDEETLRRVLQLRFVSGIAGHKTGIGLPLAMRVAQAGGGELRIASRSGNGTRVTLDLPAAT